MAISPDRSTEREHAASRWSREGDLVGPRHYIHHPSLNIVYFSNEQGCSVTAYRVAHANCTLSSVQTTSTLAQLAFPATSNHRGSGVSLSRIDA